MSEIFKIYSGKQLAKQMENKILADDVGITNFNVGSNIRSELEAIGAAISTSQIDTKEALRRAISIALYEGVGFKRKDSEPAYGYLRFYRLPVFCLIYNGTDEAYITITNTELTIYVTGQPDHTLLINFNDFRTIGTLIDEINNNENYTAIIVGETSFSTSDLFKYSNTQITNKTNYLNMAGFDVMKASDELLDAIITKDLLVTVDDITFITDDSGTIPAGESSSNQVLAYCQSKGVIGNIPARYIDTLNGDGYMHYTPTGIHHVCNDSSFQQGKDPETSLERRTRFVEYIQGLGGGRKKSIQSSIRAISGVRSVTLLESYPERGTNTIVVDTTSGLLTEELKQTINKVLYGDPDDIVNFPGVKIAGILYPITTPNIIPVTISATIFRMSGESDPDEIKNFAQTAVEKYINTLNLQADVIYSELISVIKKSHTAVYDVSITTPTSNIEIDNQSVARTGSSSGTTITINIVTRTNY